MAGTKAGKVGTPDLLTGDPGGSVFQFVSDGAWDQRGAAVNAGDPGHPGTNIRHRAPGYEVTFDVFQGTDGVRDVLEMGPGAKILYLQAGRVPTPLTDDAPRLVSIDEIRLGDGPGQVVDLTSGTLSYGNVKIVGRGGNDVILSNAGNDSLSGGAGNDYLWGGSGTDVLQGADGNDTLHGADGNDRLIGGGGSNRLLGGNGDDTLIGGATATDVLRGGNGRDVIQAGAGAKAYGEAGNDRIAIAGGDAWGGLGHDTLSASTNASQLYGGSGRDSLGGSDSDDVLEGGDGADTLSGNDGADRLDGGAGADQIAGGGGNDTLQATTGDSLNGGDGSDLFAAAPATAGATFAIGIDRFAMDTISGFQAGAGNLISVRLGDLGLSVGPVSELPGAQADVGNGFATVTYSTTPGVGGRYELASAALSEGAVITTTNASTGATAASAQFLYDATAQSLWFDADGTGAAAAVMVLQFTDPMPVTGSAEPFHLSRTDLLLTIE